MISPSRAGCRPRAGIRIRTARVRPPWPHGIFRRVTQAVEAPSRPTPADTRQLGSLASLEARWADISSRRDRRGVLLGHFRFARPATRLWLDVIVPAAFMITITGGDPNVLAIVLFCVAMGCGHAAGNMVNDIADRESDRRSKELVKARRPVAVGLISPRMAKIEAIVYLVVAAVTAVTLAALVSWVYLALIAAMALLVAFHELGDSRVQTMPLVSNLYAVPAMVVLWLAAASVAGEVQWDVAAAYILLMAVYLGPAHSLIKDVRDADNDEAGGKVTTSVKYGAGTAARYSAWSYVAVAPSWALLLSTLDLPLWAAAAGSGVLAVWIVYVFAGARRLRLGFDKRTAVRLHRGSMWTIVGLSAALAVGVLV